jgi:diguanylate cyclase (GGDEF)-like protein
MSVLFVDVDYFKRFNDTYGHAAGDEVLIAVAECIATVVRRSVDLVARYGGEEFAVVLPDTSAEGALIVAEKIRKKVQGMSVFDGASDEHGSVTVSVGCATCLPAEGGGAESGEGGGLIGQDAYTSRSRRWRTNKGIFTSI